MTYMVAHQIALAHLEAGKPEVALKSVPFLPPSNFAPDFFAHPVLRYRFLDRIVRSYRKDRFPVILTAILECLYRAAKEAKDHATMLRAGVELMSPSKTRRESALSCCAAETCLPPGSTLLPERRQELNDELIRSLQVPPSVNSVWSYF